MPTRGDSTAVSGSERLLRQNLSKAERIRSSDNQRLIAVLDAMEEEMTKKLGEDGYQDMLSRTPLDTLLKRFQASKRGKQKPTGATAKVPQNKQQEKSPASHTNDDDDEDHSFRYSTDVEQGLLDERRSAGTMRRKEIDAELDAIHASRLAHRAHDEVFDEFTAEEALKSYHRRQKEPSSDAESPETAVPPFPRDPSDGSGGVALGSKAGHEDDFNPNAVRAQRGAVPTASASPASSSQGISTSGVPVAAPVGGSSTDDPPKLDNGLHEVFATEDSTRGFLEDESSRGQFNDDSPLDEDAQRQVQEQVEETQEAQKKQNKEKEKKKRRIILNIAMHLLATFGPILLVVLVLLMLAQCVDELNPFSGNGGTAADVTNANGVSVGTAATGATPTTRRNTSSALPNVYVDPALNDMFSTDSEDGEEEEEGEEEDDGELTDAQQRVIQACKTTPSPGAGWCAAWVGDVFQNANVGVSYRGDARDWFHAFCKSASPYDGGTVSVSTPKEKRDYSTLKPAMVIAVPSSSSGTRAGAIYGHVGIYIGNNTVAHNIGSIEEWDLDRWVDTYGQYTDVGWGWADGIKLGGSGKKSGGSEKITDALNLHISSKKDIQKWAKKIDKYLAGHGAVKMGFKGEYFAEAAAQYGIDPRLSAAQSCIEQARGDIINTGDYYNLWGWGWYPGSNGLIHTSNARDACFKHAKGLSEVYGSSFGPTQVDIYCPGNTEYWPWLKREAEAITNM